MTTDKEMKQRVSEALELLTEGYTASSIVKTLSKQYKVTPQAARGYVRQARMDYHSGDEMCRNTLEWTVIEQIHRLESLSDECQAAGDHKNTIAAAKAVSKLSLDLLKNKTREQELEAKYSGKSFLAAHPY